MGIDTNSSRSDENCAPLHGYVDPLDDERAASMADEGGAAGAQADIGCAQAVVPAALRPVRARRVLPWFVFGLLAFGLTLLARQALRRA